MVRSSLIFSFALKISEPNSGGRDATCRGFSPKFFQKRHKTWGGDAKLHKSSQNPAKARATFFLTRSKFCDIISRVGRGIILKKSFIYYLYPLARGIKKISFVYYFGAQARPIGESHSVWVYNGYWSNSIICRSVLQLDH